MSRGPRLWLVCYDIADGKRLRRVYRLMRGFGDHLQHSVFRCLLSERQQAELEGRLVEAIKPSEDQVLFVPLGAPGGAAERGTFTLGKPLVHVERIVRVVGP